MRRRSRLKSIMQRKLGGCLGGKGCGASPMKAKGGVHCWTRPGQDGLQHKSSHRSGGGDEAVGV